MGAMAGFLWQHRAYKDSKGSHENENADKGFNEFLCCISGLENLINKPETILFKG